MLLPINDLASFISYPVIKAEPKQTRDCWDPADEHKVTVDPVIKNTEEEGNTMKSNYVSFT